MIVIKTMTNLPDHCYDCPCHDGESGYCQADKKHRYSDWRPFWCPLVEVNNDILHNNYIKVAYELEECKEIMNTIGGESKYAVRMDDIRRIIPTIIEAYDIERSEDE